MTARNRPTSPTTTAAGATPDARPGPRPRPDGDGSRGYLATSLGALVGVIVLAGAGIGIGIGLMHLYEDPNAGMGNLWLLVFPIGLGGLGVFLGAFFGVRTALRRVGDEHASRTAWMTVPLTVLGLGLLVAWGVGLVVLLGMPVAARWLVLRNAPATAGDRAA